MLFTLFAASAIKNQQAIGAVFFAVLIAFVLSLCVQKIRCDRTLPTALCASLLALVLLFCANARYTQKQTAVLSAETTAITASLDDLPYSENGRYYAILRVHTLNGEPANFKLRFVSNTPQDFSAHDTVYMTVKAFHLGAGSDTYDAYTRAKGIVCGAYAVGDIRTTTQTQTDLYAYILSFRASLCRKITETVSDDAGGLLAALSLGTRGYLSNSAENHFRAAGISHLLAVSGLHLTTWTLVLFEVLKACRVRRKVRAAAGLCFVLFFAVLTGGSPSVWRAAIMVGTVFAAELFRREAESFNSIGLALFLMLTVNPFAARDLSLLLSVSAAVGILLLAKPLETVLSRLSCFVKAKPLQAILKTVFSVVTVTVSASLCTLPVQMWAFGTISLAALPANFLCLTVGSIAMVCGTLGALLLLLQLSALGQMLLFAASLAAKWLLTVTAWFSENCRVLLPVNSNYSKILLALLFLGAAVLLCLRTPRKRLVQIAAAGAAAVFLFCNLTVYFVRESRLQLTVCDVGEGVAVVLHTQGETVLLCNGGDYFAESEICGILSLYGVTHLDALFLPCASETTAEAGLLVARQYGVDTVYCANTLKVETLAVGTKIVPIQQTVVRFANGDLTVCVQQNGLYAYAKILYGDFCALVSFCDTNNFYGDCADVLICTKELPKNVHPADFGCTVMSTNTPSAADFWSIGNKNIYTTAENGSVTLIAETGGTFQMTRRG
ncbi:MAG: ComEC/Rec2 family competence protein [Candidatus Fimenecus sp.]